MAVKAPLSTAEDLWNLPDDGLRHELLARDPDTVRAPDAAFVVKERAEAAGRTEKYWPGAPDFVAEIISPGDAFAEVEAKALGWLEAGTRLVLVVDPARRTATAYRGHEDVRVHTLSPAHGSESHHPEPLGVGRP
jgi:Uma2 family endonuclease